MVNTDWIKWALYVPCLFAYVMAVFFISLWLAEWLMKREKKGGRK